MRVLIFEPTYTGHHLNHVRLLCLALQEMGIDVVLSLSAAALRSKEYLHHIASLAPSTEIDATLPDKRSCWWPLQRLQILAECVRRAKAQWAYVPYADGMSQGAGLLNFFGRRAFPRGVGVEGLQMRCAAAYAQPTLRRRLKALLSWDLVCRGTWTALHFIDIHGYEHFQNSNTSTGVASYLLPEPVDVAIGGDMESGRRELNLPLDGRIIGCAACINTCKGIDLLLNAFCKARLGPQDHLLLAGPHSDRIRHLLANEYRREVQSGRIISIDRVLSHQELDASTLAMNVVCAVYPAHVGTSTTSVRAAALGRPVLGADVGWVGRMIKTFRLGRVCNVLDESELSEAIVASLDEASSFQCGEPARRFVRFNREENYMAWWTYNLRQHLGMPQSAALMHWNDALKADTESPATPQKLQLV